MFWTIILVDAIICAGLCAYLAWDKYRSTLIWFIVGFFFGFLGLIAIAGLPVDNKRSFRLEKKCPDCKESLLITVKICKYCGHKFTEKEFIGEIKQLSNYIQRVNLSDLEKSLQFLFEIEQNEIVPVLVNSLKKILDVNYTDVDNSIIDDIKNHIIKFGNSSLNISWIQLLSATIYTSKKYLIRSFKSKTFSWSVIQFFNSAYDFLIGNGSKVSVFRKILSDKAIRIFV